MDARSLWGKPQHTRAYIWVPRHDWPYVKQGRKTEFRVNKPLATFLDWPRPVVLWTADSARTFYAIMAVLLEARREPLGAISEESLRREGCESMAEFRRKWAHNHRQRGFRPLDEVTVYHVKPWTPEDADEWKERLFDHLYGPFLNGVARSSERTVG